MPRRDLLVHWVVAAVAATALIAALSGQLSFWLGLLGAAVFLLIAYNLLFSKWTVFPYDCILSAHSQDGLNWVRDDGVRVDVGGIHKSSQVYYPDVVCLDGGGYRMYYRGGGDASVILSAFSEDGLVWAEEASERIGLRQNFARLGCPEVLPIGNGYRIYFAAFSEGRWKIFYCESADGLAWGREQCCVDIGAQSPLPHVKDPSVNTIEGGYRMHFMRFSAAETHIYTSDSLDGIQWSEMELCRGYAKQDTSYVRNPNVVEIGAGKWRMYFAETRQLSALQSRIVSAVSSDGLQWVRDENDRIVPGGPLDGQGVFCPDVLRIEGGLRMYYGGYWKKHWLAPYTLYRHRQKEK